MAWMRKIVGASLTVILPRGRWKRQKEEGGKGKGEEGLAVDAEGILRV